MIQGVAFSKIARLEPITSLLEEQIAELATLARELPLPTGRTLFQAGDSNNDLFYLLEGEVELRPPHGEPYRVNATAPRGRYPLDEHRPFHVTAVAVTPVLYVRLDCELVDTMLAWAHSASADGEEVIMSGDEVMTIDTGALKARMQHSPNFRKLPAANIDLLLEKMEPVQVKAGQVVIYQGAEGDYFYVIEKGEALVTRMVEEEEDCEDSVEMANLTEGASFGEAALISNKPRNAMVSMLTDGVLLRLNKQDFLTLMQEPMQNWVSYEHALTEIDKGATWIDVRARNEFSHHHLPGALNIPLNEMHRSAKRLDRNVRYICYCRTGRRSSAAAFILSQYGLEVSVLKGGMPDRE